MDESSILEIKLYNNEESRREDESKIPFLILYKRIPTTGSALSNASAITQLIAENAAVIRGIMKYTDSEGERRGILKDFFSDLLFDPSGGGPLSQPTYIDLLGNTAESRMCFSKEDMFKYLKLCLLGNRMKNTARKVNRDMISSANDWGIIFRDKDIDEINRDSWQHSVEIGIDADATYWVTFNPVSVYGDLKVAARELEERGEIYYTPHKIEEFITEMSPETWGVCVAAFNEMYDAGCCYLGNKDGNIYLGDIW